MLIEIRHLGRRYHFGQVLEGRAPDGEDLTGRHVQVKTDSSPELFEQINVSWEHIIHVYRDETFLPY